MLLFYFSLKNVQIGLFPAPQKEEPLAVLFTIQLNILIVSLNSLFAAYHVLNS